MNKFSTDSRQSLPFSASRQNELWQYMESLHPEIVQQLSQPDSNVQKVMENHLISLLGVLPNSEFDITITTGKEELGELLFSATMYGYFLNNAYQQMKIENTWQN